MKRKLLIVALTAVLCLLAAVPAMAADTFVFTEKNIRMFEDEEITLELRQEGKYADGEIAFSSDNARAVTVSDNGTLTPVAKGRATITAALKQNGKTVRRATIEVQVIRRVTKVTLSRKNLTVIEQDDPILDGVLNTADGLPVIMLPAGKSVQLSASCTPDDANNRRVAYASSDVGIAKVSAEGSLRGVEAGECILTVSSVQNPEITEEFRVVVVQPVKKITIEAPSKTVFAGESMELDAVCSPDNATIRKVTWTSKRPGIATVDANGVVTGVSKGQAIIEAMATDGTKVVGSFTVTVQQEVTSITLKQDAVNVAVKRQVQVNASAQPAEANNRQVTWETSDPSIATVKSGTITGISPGSCYVTARSVSNPSVTASLMVTVYQPATKISFTTQNGISFHKGTSRQLDWVIEPSNATNKAVTFKSNAPKIATVDEYGVVTGIKRGSATITVTTADGSNKSANIKVNITQPVEGVNLPQYTYYVPIGRGVNIKAAVQPSDANNQKVSWDIADPSIASVRSNGTSTGKVTGNWPGTTVITTTTEDGGFNASANVEVGDHDNAVRLENLEISADNKIRIVLWNTSNYTITRVKFRVLCYDTMNYPLICNTDGVTNGFDGSYPLTLNPGERTQHGRFNFGNYRESGTLGSVTLIITGFTFDNGQEWKIPEEYWVATQPAYSRYMWTPTPTPVPVPGSDGGANG